MDLEDDDPLTLPKWPFYLGDAILVVSAIAIAGLSGWNLSNWQVASCVLAVALGAALFVLPFIVEYQLRLKDRSETFTTGQVVLGRRIGALEERIGELDERFSGLPGQLDATVRAADGMREVLGGKVVALEADLVRMKKDCASVKAVAEKGADNDSKETAAALKALRGDLDALERSAGERLKALKEAIPEDGGVQAAVFAALSDKVKSLDARLRATGGGEDAEPEGGPAERERVKPREKSRPKPSLLHRAMREKDGNGTPAVQRIISAGPKSKVEPSAGDPEKTGPQAEEPVPEVIPEKPEATKPETAEATAPPGKPETAKPEEPHAPKPEAGNKPAAPELLVDLPETVEKRRVRPKAGDAYVVANVFIGIGNKPFIRGSGGGLDWDRGVPMDFEEIGKWRWIAPPGCGEIEVAVYRNDTDPDRGGRHLLKPGEKLELKPEFD